MPVYFRAGNVSLKSPRSSDKLTVIVHLGGKQTVHLVHRLPVVLDERLAGSVPPVSLFLAVLFALDEELFGIFVF